MKSYVEELRRFYLSSLELASLEYLRLGLRIFHEQRRDRDYNQTSLGNLAIAVELMLKTVIAYKNLSILFKDLPVEVRLLLTSPDSLPHSFNWRAFDIDLRSPKYKTLEFDECVAIFYHFYPDLRQELQAHLKHLASYRNASVHFILPKFHKYEAERAAYIALRLCDTLAKLDVQNYSYSEEDAEFLRRFQNEKMERVRSAIEAAKVASKKLGNQQLITETDFQDWDNLMTKCPICGSSAYVGGYCDLETTPDPDGPGEIPIGLKFRASGFRCSYCELELDDEEEIKFAGIPIEYDRTDELYEYCRDTFTSAY